MATSPKERGVAFGGYRFEGDSGRLWSGAREIRLTPKAAAVLEQLVRQAGEPVSKERLFETVWNGTAVSDDALTSCSQATAAEQGCRSATPASSPKTRGNVISMPFDRGRRRESGLAGDDTAVVTRAAGAMARFLRQADTGPHRQAR